MVQTIYDIVKAHGGEIKVETKEGEGLPGEQTGSEFVIVLPITPRQPAGLGVYMAVK